MAYDFRHVAELVPGYREPASPYMLLQECVPNTAWHQASAPIFVRDDRARTHYAAWDFFGRFEKPEDVINESNILRAQMLTVRQRESLLRIAAYAVIGKYPRSSERVPGFNQFVYDSFQVFHLNNLRISPADQELAMYVRWRLTCV